MAQLGQKLLPVVPSDQVVADSHAHHGRSCDLCVLSRDVTGDAVV